VTKDNRPQFYLVDRDALPEVFIRVTEAKELLLQITDAEGVIAASVVAG